MAQVQPKEPRDLSVRKGLVARRSIAKGETFGPDNLRFAWPPLGVSVEYWDLVVGSSAARNLDSGKVIRWNDVRFPS